MKKEKKQIAFVLIAGGALMLSAPKTHAQQQDTTKLLKLNEVVVSATRSERNPIDVGRSVTVISSEQVKNSGANNMAELLSQQEGIYIVGTGLNPGQTQNIFMRGANSNQVAIMIDGVRMTEPSATDNAIDLSEISLANIERIEIVRGSHSTLYGSSAIGGVINIITKKNSTPGIHTDAEIKTGNFGSGTSTYSENVFLNYTHKNGFYVNGEIYNNDTKGLNATVDTVTNPKDYGHNHRDRDGFTKTDLIGKIGYKTGKFDIYASYKSTRQKADIDAGAFADDPAYTVAYNRNLYTYGAAYKVNDKFSIAYIGATTDMKRIALDDSSIVDYNGNYNHTYFKGTYSGNTSTNEIQGNYKTKGLNIVFGGGAFDEKMTFESYYFSSAYGSSETKTSLDSLHINVKTISGFVHADIDGSIVNDKYNAFAIGLGMRNTRHDLFGSNLTYEINPSLKVSTNGLLFASYSTGFNAPSLYQLYSPDKDLTSGITRGNNTLKPETSNSFEIGFKQKVTENTFVFVSFFKTIVENSIDYVYLWNKNKRPDSLSYGDYRGDTYLNIGKQTNQGIELGVSSKVNEKLSISCNVSLISGKLDYTPSSIDNTHTKGNSVQLFANGAFINKDVESIGLVRRPGTGNISLTYKPVNKLSLTTNVRYAGPRSDIYYSASSGPFGALATQGVADYTLLDFIIKYKITKQLSATLRIENVFDEQYSEISGYTTRGRGLYLALRYNM